MLMYSVLGILEGLTKLNLVQSSGIIGSVYCSWAIGQFFDKTKKISYLKAFLSYFLGLVTFAFIVGYTSGGFPYGITHEEMDEIENSIDNHKK